MGSISELVYYCKEKSPVGALLMSGEWGCGKTYLIEHELRDRLKDECVIIRISLFGISSIDELHKAVRHAWIHAKGGFLDKASGLGRFKGFLERIADAIPNEAAKCAVESALSFNLFEFIKIENIIDEKQVVLVFDDLERCNLPTQDKLGVINEYCENQHFRVIIIADEKKLNSTEYQEFKEKAIQRTVHYRPKYKDIVHSILCSVEEGKYELLLRSNEANLSALFAGQDLEGNSLDIHVDENHRSFKSLYKQEGVDDEERKKELLRLNIPVRRSRQSGPN